MPSSGVSFKEIVVMVIAVVAAFIIGGSGGYFIGTKNVTPPPTIQKNTYDIGEAKLPTQSVRVSGCIPRMGYHWTLETETGLERGYGGPTYNVFNNKIIGVEYHLPLTDASKYAQGTILGKFGEFNLFKGKYDHVTFSPVPLGHGGIPVPHWDVHFYFISPAEVAAITCVGAPPPATPSAQLATPSSQAK